MNLLNPLKLNRCDWFLIAWVIYYLQGIAYPSGGVISVGLLAVNLFVSMVYMIKAMQMSNNPVYFKGLNLLIMLFTIYGIAYVVVNPLLVSYSQSGMIMPSYNYLKSIYLSLMPIYPFYYFARKGYLTAGRLRMWGVVFLVSIVLLYFRMQREAFEKAWEIDSTADEVTNNAGYLFLSCIPLLVLYRAKPLIQFAALAFVMTFIVMGMKRGAIFLGAVVFLYFMFQAIKNSKGKYRFFFAILSIALCAGTISLFIYQMENSDYMMRRIENTIEGNSSHRDDIYSYFWNYFVSVATPIQFLLGRGANGTLEVYYNYAHNDWLEIAVNQGVLGILVYISYWKNLIKTWKCATNIDVRAILAVTILRYFAKTLFSMSYADMTFVNTSVLGYALANVNCYNLSDK